MAHVAGLGGCSEHSGGPAQMEMRYKEVDRARNIFERYVRCIPTVKSYVRYAKFEMRNGDVTRSRRCYERAVEELGEDAQTVRPSPALHCRTGSNTPAVSASCLLGCSIAPQPGICPGPLLRCLFLGAASLPDKAALEFPPFALGTGRDAARAF